MIRTFVEKLRGAIRSYVVWFNGVLGLVLASWPMLADSLPQLQPYLPERAFRNIAIAVLVVNILLRFKTGKPLQDK
jgi:hypothetical protein